MFNDAKRSIMELKCLFLRSLLEWIRAFGSIQASSFIEFSDLLNLAVIFKVNLVCIIFVPKASPLSNKFIIYQKNPLKGKNKNKNKRKRKIKRLRD